MVWKKQQQMIGLLRIIRPLNLLIIALIMYVMRYNIILPFLEIENAYNFQFQLQFSDFNFFLLVLSSILIAAAGYIINDYFDIQADKINRKKNAVVVGRIIKRRVAMALHITLSATGILIGIYLSWQIGMINLAIIHIFVAGSLWYYSVLFKKELLIGNITIGILSSLIPLLPGIYEIPLLSSTYAKEVTEAFAKFNIPWTYKEYFMVMFYFILGYSAFAFIVTIMREIIKDMADFEGDETSGCKTLPIVYGNGITKVIVNGINLVILTGLFLVYKYFLNTPEVLLYFILAIGIPLIASGVLTFNANTRNQYMLASNLTKVAMVTATLFPVFINPYL